MLTPEEQETVATYNKVAGIWTNNHHSQGFWSKEMARFKKLLPTGKILDVGSGGPRDGLDLVALGYDYVGTDISDELLRLAKKELPHQKFYKRSIYKLNFPNNEKFDGFWCSAVLLHIPKSRIGAALQSIKSVMKPGAYGFISVKDGIGEKLLTENWDNGEVHKRLFAYYSKDELSKVIESNGFKVVDYIYRPDSAKTQWHCLFVKVLHNIK